ncbi:MAG: single-stranded-DNA-specific exonuclease RecJ, partial [Synechococcaceae bacterium WB6_3A_227]|nr:single-stranded-DNA-specific exonuclease RecJ [Synechococcaceae bacterium WB6_3A_227]
MVHPPSAPDRVWQLPLPLDGADFDSCCDLPVELLAVLQRRGLTETNQVEALLKPATAPPALKHFPHLAIALERLEISCRQGELLAICGDYDADGMTSTALLVGVLQRLGAKPIAAIPSRQEDGYGLNAAMVERLAANGCRLLVTVDNGISAREALHRAQALGVEVIVTDHHSIPAEMPPLLALLHPATTPDGSPYRGLAGVGLAYVLARGLAQKLKRADALQAALDLFCIGTIADMAPLVGVNRLWLMEGLSNLHRSQLPGLRALAQLAGLEDRSIDSQAVAFLLAPRLNAVGRLADPALAVELLTTSDQNRALELADQCEALNRQRRDLCDGIEAEAQALVEADGPQRSTSLAATMPISGHPAAGGFTVRADQVAALHEQLSALAAQWLQGRSSALVVAPEALLPLGRIDADFLHQMQRLEPFGVGNPTPLFWARHCQVKRSKLLRGGHLSLELAAGSGSITAIAWRWNGPEPTTRLLDLAFRLQQSYWQGQLRLQLELEALRP